MNQVENLKRGLNEEDVGRRAILLWEREGRPEGRALDHWLQAEAQLAAEGRPDITTDEARGAAHGRAAQTERRSNARRRSIHPQAPHA